MEIEVQQENIVLDEWLVGNHWLVGISTTELIYGETVGSTVQHTGGISSRRYYKIPDEFKDIARQAVEQNRSIIVEVPDSYIDPSVLNLRIKYLLNLRMK